MNRLFYEPGVSELHLFGFDATRPEQPGWGEARETACKWPERFGADSHDHETEKRLLWQLVHERTWLGRIVGGLPVHWHAAPEVVA